MNEKVSVIMATHNTPRRFIDASINSILKQTYTNLELIIVCDGNKDEYRYITSKYKKDRVKILFNEQNKGLAFSLNKGISISSGKYIARMDSDDISALNRIEKELAFLKKNNLDVCSTAAFTFGDKLGFKKKLFRSTEDIKIYILFMSTLIHPSIMGKAEIFKDNRYNENFVCSQDFELWSRLAEKYKIGFLNKPLLKYRIHEKQASIEKKELQDNFARMVIKNNASKISGKYDEKIYNCLWLLGGRKKITNSNFKSFSELIDYTISQNLIYKNYDIKSMKRIFYNRYFELMLKYKICRINFSSLRKIAHLYNIIDLFVRCLDKMRIVLNIK